jgi:hypothetical protein
VSGRRTDDGRPTYAELLTAIDEHESGLAKVIGRWFDGVESKLRFELSGLRAPLEELLIRARRRP